MNIENIEEAEISSIIKALCEYEAEYNKAKNMIEYLDAYIERELCGSLNDAPGIIFSLYPSPSIEHALFGKNYEEHRIYDKDLMKRLATIFKEHYEKRIIEIRQMIKKDTARLDELLGN